jgi:hypothetical protein
MSITCTKTELEMKTSFLVFSASDKLKNSVCKLAHKLAKVTSATRKKQASGKQTAPAVSLLLQVKKASNLNINTTETSVPTNVSVENQTKPLLILSPALEEHQRFT